jgi:chromatin segregation and condensation protein Rec8/ScpA/Scc1 (kleisin family)
MAPKNSTAEQSLHGVTALGVIAPPPIHVQTPTFEGSLAMLFKCVRDGRVDLLGVPLMPICEAYFAYLLTAKLENLDEAAAALVALAYLIERKAWALLPIAEPADEEPVAEDLLELAGSTAHEFALAIDALRTWHEERSQKFFRSPEAGPEVYELPYQLQDVTPADLARALERVLRRAVIEPVQPLSKPRRSLSEQMRVVLKALRGEWQGLDVLIEQPFTREDAVYWFLALLELIRLGQAVVRLGADDVEFARAA